MTQRNRPGQGEGQERGRSGECREQSLAREENGWFVPENARRSARLEPDLGEKMAEEGGRAAREAGGCAYGGFYSGHKPCFLSLIETDVQQKFALSKYSNTLFTKLTYGPGTWERWASA